MPFTKEQFQTFKQHFIIMEITHATVEATADLDFENFEEYHNEPDSFFLETNWVRYPANVTSSEGYHIQYKPTDDFVKSIRNINDVADFIENEMTTYLTERNQKG